MTTSDWRNKLYYGDNLVWLRDKDHFPNDSVDLIYLDPPFNSNADYNVVLKEPEGQESPAQTGAFDDTWKWDSVASEEALKQLGMVKPDVLGLIQWIAQEAWLRAWKKIGGKNPVYWANVHGFLHR